MNKGLVKTTLCAFLSVLTALAFSVPAFAVENSNPEFLFKVKSDGGFQYLEKNNELSSEKISKKFLKKSSLPSSYNLADHNYVTSVKDQMQYDTCWAFSAIASLESNMIKSNKADSSVDLSERHLAYFNYSGMYDNQDKSLFAGFDTYSANGYTPFKAGGSMYMAAATLMRGYGAVDESKAPYPKSSNDSTSVDISLQGVSDMRVKNVEFLPETTLFEYGSTGYLSNQTLRSDAAVAESINEIKSTIYDKGAVVASYYVDTVTEDTSQSNYWDDEHHSYYFDAKISDMDNYCSPNHAITIVGWDDNFSKNNFKKTPPHDGAWIVKNSWGNDWGNKGYFYLSYYDLSFYQPTVFEAEDAKYKSDSTTRHQYQNIYQYDGIGFADTQVYYQTPNCQTANFFTARDNEYLEAISVVTMQENCTVNYVVYDEVDSNVDPTMGYRRISGSESFKNTGYYTIPLDSPVYLPKGDRYTIVINITFEDSDGTTFSILSCETKLPNTSSRIEVKNNQSSYYVNGKWNSIDSSTSILDCKIGNANVKAYTNNADRDDYAIYGDANDDGQITVDDVTLIQKFMVQLADQYYGDDIICDVTDGGAINIDDATYVQKYLAGNPDCGRTGQKVKKL